MTITWSTTLDWQKGKKCKWYSNFKGQIISARTGKYQSMHLEDRNHNTTEMKPNNY